jgi:imidazoleglycerol phosphate dehydratase HisB
MTIMADRKAKIARKTNETDIKLAINLDAMKSTPE